MGLLISIQVRIGADIFAHQTHQRLMDLMISIQFPSVASYFAHRDPSRGSRVSWSLLSLIFALPAHQ
jgi:hypothetical protein